MADGDQLQAEQWKRKYYDSLEQHERNERQWTQLEELLRRTISRLTLAADGLNPTLDRQLLDLRNAIRDKVSGGVLQSRIEAMSDTLVSLDREKRRKADAPRPQQVLAQLLERLELPRGMGRKTKGLQKQLAGVDGEVDVLLGEFASLVHEALAFAVPENGGDAHSESGGLLRRLLGRNAATASVSNADAIADARSPDRAAEPPGRANDAAAATRRDTLAIHEVLLQLLERLDLPAEMSPRLAALKDRLEGAQEDWPHALEDIATLVSELRNQAQQEKRDIETFLQELTQRLQELDLNIQGTETAQEKRLQSGRELDAAVQEQVRGIQSSVHQATDLTQLKNVIQERLATIDQHMQAFRAAEERRSEEVEQHVRTLTERLHLVEGETERLRKRIYEERSQALIDPLTGIPNRLAYDERIAQEFARWKRFQSPLALLVWDVDHFKEVNDEYGHKAGDKVLKTIAELLQGQIRETDFIARYGGEEFVMLMTGAEPAAAREVAEKLRLAVQNCGFHYRGTSVPITISCGLSLFGTGDTPELVFERADSALYQAKEQGRNCCRVYQT